MPPGWNLKDVGGVGTDSKDRVYVFNRGEHPMIVFDREGKFLRSWGEGLFKRAHGVLIDREETAGDIYVLDGETLKVTHNVTLAGFNRIELLDGLPRKLATMDACRREIGLRAARIVAGHARPFAFEGVMESAPGIQRWLGGLIADFASWRGSLIVIWPKAVWRGWISRT